MKSQRMDKEIGRDTTIAKLNSDVPPADLIELENDLIAFAERTDSVSVYKGTYSREDIYFDHD